MSIDEQLAIPQALLCFIIANVTLENSEINLIAGLSACPGGDCSSSHSSDSAKCYPLKISVFRTTSNVLDNWTSPTLSDYNQLHGL